MFRKKHLTPILLLLALAMLLSACGSPEPEPSPTPDLVEEVLPTPTIEPTPEPTPSPTPEPTPTPEPNAATGVQGYISMPNTKVDYLITLGEDNDYYLEHDINGKKTVYGWIYFDYRNADPARRRNVIIYGHNMKDDTMFGDLHKYEDKDFFKKNMEYEMEMFGERYRIRLAYVAMINYKEYNFIKTKFKDDADFLDFINTALTTQARFKDEEYTPSADDTLITLVTCVSRRESNKDLKRWVVVGRVVEDLGPAQHETAGYVTAQN
ncbi:MAG: class B sortase [Christensenellales bacterium]